MTGGDALPTQSRYAPVAEATTLDSERSTEYNGLNHRNIMERKMGKENREQVEGMESHWTLDGTARGCRRAQASRLSGPVIGR